MTNEPHVSEDGPYRVLRWLGTPVRRVNSTLHLGPPVRGNATAEELTWPVVSPARRVNSTFFDGPPIRGNATAEELTWPVADTGSRVISGPALVAAPPTDADLHRVERELSELLTRLPPSDRELVLDRLGQLLLAHRAA